MSYFILRHGQQYGPYSPANLQLYLSIGNISLSDLGRTEAMNEWLPLAQIASAAALAQTRISAGGAPLMTNAFGTTPPAPNGTGGNNVQPMRPPGSTPTCAGYSMPPDVDQGNGAPLPPGMHWALLLFVVIVTLGLFGVIWAFVQANWVRKIDQQSKAILLLVISVASSLAGQVLNVAREHSIALPVLLAAVVFLYVAVFSMRASIERYYNTVEPRGLKLSGVMTFFFGGFYFQYHLHRILQEKRSAPLAHGPTQYHCARPA